MILEKKNAESSAKLQEQDLLKKLDRGIEDMENGNVLPHEEAMKKINEAVSNYVI